MIGLAISIITDGGEALGAIAAFIPETLAATVPGAIAVEVLDAGASVLKNARHFVSANTLKLLRKIPYDTVLKRIGPQLLYQLANKAVKKVGVANWPTGSLSEKITRVLAIINDVLHSVWDPFVRLLKYLWEYDMWDELGDIGFGEGGFIAGRALLSNGSLTPDVVRTLAHLGDDLAKAGIKLSDEAIEGLGKLARYSGNEFREGLITAIRKKNPASLEPLLVNANAWDEVAGEGFGKLARAGIDDDALSDFLIKHADDAPTSNKMLSIIGNSSRTWNGQAFDGLGKVVEHSGIEIAESLANRFPDVAEESFQVLSKMAKPWRQEAVDGVAILARATPGQDVNRTMRLINKTGGTSYGERMHHLIQIADSKEIDGYNKVLESLTRNSADIGNDLKGTFHVLDSFDRKLIEIDGKVINWDDINAFEVRLSQDGVTRYYDAVLKNTSGGFRMEFKNRKTFDAAQFRKDLELLDEDELEDYYLIFRGSEVEKTMLNQAQNVLNNFPDQDKVLHFNISKQLKFVGENQGHPLPVSFPPGY
ncbi:MAG: hypothetical protein JW953_13350 [Anaerolineae bacterium]|nr:hypothetical protein [Anaerolineae bacterium]